MKKYVLVLFIVFLISSSNVNLTYAQWESVGPYGGSVSQVWANNSYLFVLLQNNGIFRSSNNGLNWNRLNLESTSNSSYFAGIGSNIVYLSPSRLFRSSDNGDSWYLSSNGLPTTFDINTIISNLNVFYLVVNGNLYKSTDYGENWLTLNLTLGDVRLAISGTNIYAYGSGGIRISIDGGVNWSYINNGLPGATFRGKITTNSSTVFINMDSSNVPRGIYKTTNNGMNWFPSNTGLTNLKVRELYVIGNTVFVGTLDGIFKSSDNGNSWARFNNGIEPIYCNSIYSINSNFYAGFGTEYGLGGLYLSQNEGVTWNSIIGNINSCQIFEMTVKGNTIFAYVNGSGIWKSLDNGINWIRSNNGLPYNVLSFRGDIISNDGQNIYCVISGNIYKSSDEGNNWFLYNNGIGSNPNYITSNNSKVYAGCSQGLYLSLNSGGNWSLLGLSELNVRAIDFYGNYIYAGTDNGVFQSSDDGLNWEEINTGLQDTSVRFLKVVGDYLYASNSSTNSGGGVYKRSLTGGNWILLTNGFIFTSIRNFCSINNYPIIIDRSSGAKMLISTNQGESWTNVNNQGITAPYIFTLQTLGNFVYLGTYGGSVCRRPISQVIGINQISTKIPESIYLSQNYPNPFNPTTNIEFSLPENSFVKLKVFDITGKEVAELVNENLTPGSFRYEFNAKNLPSGLYFYKLETEKFSETKKMIILK